MIKHSEFTKILILKIPMKIHTQTTQSCEFYESTCSTQAQTP